MIAATTAAPQLPDLLPFSPLRDVTNQVAHRQADTCEPPHANEFLRVSPSSRGHSCTPPPPLMSPSVSPVPQHATPASLTVSRTDFRRTPGKASDECPVQCYSGQKVSVSVALSVVMDTFVSPPSMDKDLPPLVAVEADSDCDADIMALASDSEDIPPVPELISGSAVKQDEGPCLPELVALSPPPLPELLPTDGISCDDLILSADTDNLLSLYRSRLNNPKRKSGPKPPRPQLPVTSCPWRL